MAKVESAATVAVTKPSERGPPNSFGAEALANLPELGELFTPVRNPECSLFKIPLLEVGDWLTSVAFAGLTQKLRVGTRQLRSVAKMAAKPRSLFRGEVFMVPESR
mmetsp:Transcript_55925/g.100571  ORF Transcript_55925/g.100571 Transcript_55925/m.100571 type:complete len:106 (-) Transcript_55925:65-382(-)